MKKTFYSNGKLLITGEYVVLDGAVALALPTKMGQNLIIENGFDKKIVWKSYDFDGSIWFDDTILFSDIRSKKYFENNITKTTLVEILYESFLLNSDFINHSDGYIVSTNLTFPKFWGLGTSSTLINNIASWLQIDAFVLLKNAFGGSGYDIACAQNDLAILYRLEKEKPIIKTINFNPTFKENIYFVYLNKKQNSKNAIANYRKKQGDFANSIAIINEITKAIINTTELEEFAKQIEKHEVLMSKILEMQTIKEVLFPDFDGAITSLGAWGGDFVMAISKNNPIDYFSTKGYDVVLLYDEMIL
ncbi:GHMP kinase [Flavobacterium psychrophilum]|uniref:GYDIA family GHMP kinase n=1 Tax=Flavobacterium psychrophilum TaxID=96345 RepID=UPI0004F5F931|nr:GYDIA family GHMP kinase [Flavobacterium psychrophilum]AIN74896.1 GHMP kinase [Flavobacterium psychrophilum FPG3]EKT2068794.1 GHMP kinase [Flavobacterium psychrophilum]EKT2070902.1 GHMP kinase [Flavobacterium psychrophilum]EKT3956813.1 GHMP kinase [Flavobacterium psychrophilum]EKT3963367.1 GHMP kinase [Flavobacterium psychrophilum]